MAQPSPYVPDYSFTDHTTSFPTTPQPGDKLDAEFQAIKETTDEILANLELIQRDDGELANETVGRDQLKEEIVMGVNTPTPWLTATAYTVRDSVIKDSAWYWCTESHTSGTFSVDLGSGFWELIFDFGIFTLNIPDYTPNRRGTLVAQNATDDGMEFLPQGTAGTWLKSFGNDALPVFSALSDIDTTMFAANVIDTDTALAAASNTRLATQAAVKAYVDNSLAGLKWKPAVKCASTGNLTLSGEQTIDGVLTSASRVLVKNQSTGSQNGIYVTAAGAWSRATDADTGAELVQAAVFISEGTTLADTAWVCTNNSITLGSTSVAFAQFAGGVAGLMNVVEDTTPELGGTLDALGNGINNLRGYNQGFNVNAALANGTLEKRFYFTSATRLYNIKHKTASGTINMTLSKNGSTDINFGASPSTTVSVSSSLTTVAVNHSGNAYIDFAQGDYIVLTLASNSSGQYLAVLMDIRENYV